MPDKPEARHYCAQWAYLIDRERKNRDEVTTPVKHSPQKRSRCRCSHHNHLGERDQDYSFTIDSAAAETLLFRFEKQENHKS
jgi:hypothetical protein